MPCVFVPGETPTNKSARSCHFRYLFYAPFVSAVYITQGGIFGKLFRSENAHPRFRFCCVCVNRNQKFRDAYFRHNSLFSCMGWCTFRIRLCAFSSHASSSLFLLPEPRLDLVEFRRHARTDALRRRRRGGTSATAIHERSRRPLAPPPELMSDV